MVEFHDGDSAAVKTWLEVDQPYANHNGGNVVFGPDGRLYVGMGDGGSGGDPENRAQDRSQLLGKLLSIDVDGGDPKPQIAAIGLRNPWRFSFSPDGKQILDRRRRPERVGGDRPRAVPAAGRTRTSAGACSRATHEFADGGAEAGGLHRAGVRVLARRRRLLGHRRRRSIGRRCTCSATTARASTG